MVIERVQKMSVEEFLNFAERSEYPYEFIEGEPIEMTGGKLNHFRLINRLQQLLESLLPDSDCEVLGSGMLVRVGDASLVSPDVIVVCGEPETESDTRILLNPILVVEVTSPSSIDHDRVVKRDFYESVDSIQAYLIVDQDRMLAELFARTETGWHLQTFSQSDEEVPLKALNCSLSLRDIYRNVEFETGDSSDANEAEGSV
ncbi:MAG: Uma2 family endonuclease [Chloroflexi bacterium]|nr:Uma2 family endonuclease [Chloroflexota bacterium]